MKKNGKIEFYRFIFALCVMFYHFRKWSSLPPVSLKHGVHLAFFCNGNMAVEFFFILSGVLMANSIYKRINTENMLVVADRNVLQESNDWLGFFWKKYKAILPYWIPAFTLTFLSAIYLFKFGLRDIVELAINNIPTALLIQMTGINPDGCVMGPSWYISAMMVAMAIIYPFCKKYYYSFTRYYAPLIGILILGFMQIKTGSLTDIFGVVGGVYKGLLRAITEILIGTSVFEISRMIKTSAWSEKPSNRIKLSIIETGCLLIIISFMVLSLKHIYQVYMVGAFSILIAIAFSGKSICNDRFDNKISAFLGSLSLPLYLSQRCAWNMIGNSVIEQPFSIQILAGIASTIVVTTIVMLVGKTIKKKASWL